MCDRELLRSAQVGVSLPFVRRRKPGAVPSHIAEPKKRAAISVLEATQIARHPNRPVLVQSSLGQGGHAFEFAAEGVEVGVRYVRAGGVVGPLTGHIRCEAHPPGLAAVPKTFRPVGLTERGDEGCGEFHLLQRIRIGDAALQDQFEACPFGNRRRAGRLWRCGKAGAGQQRDAQGSRPPKPPKNPLVHGSISTERNGCVKSSTVANQPVAWGGEHSIEHFIGHRVHSAEWPRRKQK